MAEIEVIKSEDGQTYTVKSDKTEKALIVYKPQDGYKFYAVKYANGAPLPAGLQGSWTGAAGALAAVKLHLAHKKPTARKAVNDRAKERQAEKEKLNATKSDPENG